MLRLGSATIGPIPVAAAGPSTTQVLEAYNAGDGALALTFESDSWISASLGSTRGCHTLIEAVGKTCLTINVTINTAGLPQGLTTGTLTVKDPNAVDAPQTVTVTVRVGAFSATAAPGVRRDDLTFATYPPAIAQTPSKDTWLSVVSNGSGSFRFNYPYQVVFQPAASMPEGSYASSVTISGGSNAADNQTIPVNMQVTAKPIALPSTDRLVVRLAQDAPALVYPFSPIVSLSNVGAGTLTIQDTTVSGGAWLKKDVIPPFFAIDPAGLSVGKNSGAIAFTTNAANGTVTVPVDLIIVPKGAPTVFYQGVLDNATFVPGDTVSQGDIMIVKGEQLSTSGYTPGTAPPLPTKLGGTSVLVNGKAVPLFYTSYGQIAFEMPVDTPLGMALVQVQREDNSISNKVSVQVAERAPRLVVTVNQDGSINSPSKPARPGDYLTIYAIGFGATNPAVATGVAAPSAEPLARVTPTPTVIFGSAFATFPVTPAFAGLTPTFSGLYQVNVQVPADVPTGAVQMQVTVGDTASNTVTLYVQ